MQENREKMEFVEPKVEVIEFNQEDVIVTSEKPPWCFECGYGYSNY